MSNQILIVLPGDKLAGAENVLFTLAESFYLMGWSVNVLIWFVDRHKTGQWNGYKNSYNIITVEEASFRGVYNLGVEIKKITKQKNIDLTISSNITLNSILGLFRRLGILKTNRLVVREPSSPFLRYDSRFKKIKYKARYIIGYRFVDYIIFQTSIMKKVFFENVNIELRNGVYPNPIKYNQILELAKQNDEIELKINGDYIVAAGRFIEEKGFELLINSFNQIVNKKINLLILGSGTLEDELKKLTKDLGISDKVIFAGFVKNPFTYFKKAKLCVISSRVEGFPNTLLQMLSVNENVITTDCCGDLDLIPGINIVPFDLKELTIEIDKYLSVNYNNIFNREEVSNYLLNRNANSYVDRLLKEIEL